MTDPYFDKSDRPSRPTPLVSDRVAQGFLVFLWAAMGVGLFMFVATWHPAWVEAVAGVVVAVGRPLAILAMFLIFMAIFGLLLG